MKTNTHTNDGSTAADWSARLIGSARVVYASEAESPWFPQLAERLQSLLPALPGRFVLV